MDGAVSMHIADVGVGKALGLVRRSPSRWRIRGLRHGDIGLAAPLSASVRPSPSIGRVAFIGFWESDASLAAFVGEHPIGRLLNGGWHAALEPVRVFGSWPGLAADLSRSRDTALEGAAVVVTLGRLRLSQAARFLRASARAQEAALQAPGALWATAFARPPFVATCSVWASVDALKAYAYADVDAGHPRAIAANDARAFHHQSAFVRFRPTRVEGSLSGRNPLLAGALAAAAC
jgi:hypothetical protein